MLPRDTLQAILDLKAANIHTDPAGREYADKNLIPLKPPAHDPVSVRTLTGFVDLCEAGIIEPFKADAPVTPPAGPDRAARDQRDLRRIDRHRARIAARRRCCQGGDAAPWIA